jgi:hypothetical protein
MSENERILDGMTVREAITRCGELQLPHDQVATLIADIHPVNRKQMLSDLQTPGADEHEWYRSGIAEGNLQLNINLKADVTRSEKDAYKHLSAERRRQAINRKIEELFGT